MAGYFLGLITATLCSELFRSAQPGKIRFNIFSRFLTFLLALLYLVPFTLLPLVLISYVRGDLYGMWNFPLFVGQDSHSLLSQTDTDVVHLNSLINTNMPSIDYDPPPYSPLVTFKTGDDLFNTLV